MGFFLNPGTGMWESDGNPSYGNVPIAISSDVPSPPPPSIPAMPPDLPAPPQYVFPVDNIDPSTVWNHGGGPLGGGNSGGADIMAPRGSPVRAIEGGTVTFAGINPLGGYVVEMQGDSGNASYYAHMQEPPLVTEGDYIQSGTPLGTVGDTGNARGGPTHLHFGMGKEISVGAGPNGGVGTDFDAVAALRAAQLYQPSPPPPAMENGTAADSVPPIHDDWSSTPAYLSLPYATGPQAVPMGDFGIGVVPVSMPQGQELPGFGALPQQMLGPDALGPQPQPGPMPVSTAPMPGDLSDAFGSPPSPGPAPYPESSGMPLSPGTPPDLAGNIAQGLGGINALGDYLKPYFQSSVQQAPGVIPGGQVLNALLNDPAGKLASGELTQGVGDVPVLGGIGNALSNLAYQPQGVPGPNASLLESAGYAAQAIPGISPGLLAGEELAGPGLAAVAPALRQAGEAVGPALRGVAEGASSLLEHGVPLGRLAADERGGLALPNLTKPIEHTSTALSVPADNVINLRDINPEAVAPADQLANAFRGAVNVRQVEEVSAPAVREIERVKPIIASEAANLSSQADQRIAEAFVRDADGTIPSLRGVNPLLVDEAGQPLAPTVQDVAARLPSYWSSLTDQGRATMGWLQTVVGDYRKLEEALAPDRKALENLHTRQDVREGGGFYLPRGLAEDGGADAGVIRGTSSHAAEQPSMTVGIAKGELYPTIGQALASFVHDSGNRILNQHVANYFTGIMDSTGQIVGQSAADRVDPLLRAVVEGIRADLAGKRTTFLRQEARLGSQRLSTDAAQRLADRVRAVSEKAAVEADALSSTGSTDELIKDAERKLASVTRQAEKARVRQAETVGRYGGVKQVDAMAAKLESEGKQLVDGVAARYETKVMDTAAAQTLEMAHGLPSGTLPRPQGMANAAAIAKTIQDAGRDLHLLQQQADRMAVFTDGTGRALQEAKRVADAAKVVSDHLQQQKDLAAELVTAMRNTSTPEVAVKGAERRAAELDRVWQNAQLTSQRLLNRYLETTQRIPATQADIAGLQAQMKAINGRYQHALGVAQNTPRGMGVIQAPGLRHLAFPDAMADAMNHYIKSQQPLHGKGATTLNTIHAINNLLRGIHATADESAVMIQGLLGLGSDAPAYSRAVKASIEAFRAGPVGEQTIGAYFRSFDGRAVRDQLPLVQNWAQAGLHLGGAEWELSPATGTGRLGRLISNAPVFKQSNQAFGYFGDTLRLEWANDLLKTELASGRNIAEIRSSGDMDRIANAANVLTGWSKSRFGGEWGDILLFAPRFLAARLETLTKASAGITRAPGAALGLDHVPLDQRIARESVLRTLAWGVGLTLGLNAALGNETDAQLLITDQHGTRMNPNFMRIRAFGQDWSLFGTYDSLLRAVVSVAAGHPETAIRGMTSPGVSATWDLLKGRDFQGSNFLKDPASFAGWLASQFAPFSVSNVGQAIQAGQENGIPAGIAGLALAVIGMKGTPLSFSDVRDLVSQKLYGQPYGELGNPAKQRKVMEFPSVKARLDALPAPDAGTVEQQNAFTGQRYQDVKTTVIQSLRNHLDAGMQGAALRKQIQATRANLVQAANTLTVVRPGEPPPTKNDIATDLATRYLAVDRYEDPVTGRPDYARQDGERAQILEEARRAGVDENFITGRGPDSFRAQLTDDPVVRVALDSDDAARATLKPYWQVRDQVLLKYPSLKSALDTLQQGADKYRAQGDIGAANIYEQKIQEIEGKAITPFEHQMRATDPAVEQALERLYDYTPLRPKTPARQGGAAPTSSARRSPVTVGVR